MAPPEYDQRTPAFPRKDGLQRRTRGAAGAGYTPGVRPLVLLSGFGPYEKVVENPSAVLVRALSAAPPAGVEVHSAPELPVSFDRATAAWDALHGAVLPRRPGLVVAVGAAPKEAVLRLESRARGALPGLDRPDVDGVLARDTGRAGATLTTDLDLAAVRDALSAEGYRELRLSDDAGGYVCERLYHHVLATVGGSALFLHVPPFAAVPLERQTRLAGRMIELLLAQL